MRSLRTRREGSLRFGLREETRARTSSVTESLSPFPGDALDGLMDEPVFPIDVKIRSTGGSVVGKEFLGNPSVGATVDETGGDMQQSGPAAALQKGKQTHDAIHVDGHGQVEIRIEVGEAG